MTEAEQPNQGQEWAEADEAQLLEGLRRGDGQAFITLVERYHGTLVRLAMSFVGSRATAEDVAQETWLGVLRGLPTFEGRSSLKTWIFRILTNRAKTRGAREGRSIPFSDMWTLEQEPGETAVAPEHFQGANDPEPGHWRQAPSTWAAAPVDRVLSAELRDTIEAAIAELPASQQSVITLRDLEGWSALETCNILQISESNQRVLLHRARARVRRAIERYVQAAEEAT